MIDQRPSFSTAGTVTYYDTPADAIADAVFWGWVQTGPDEVTWIKDGDRLVVVPYYDRFVRWWRPDDER